MRPAQVLAGGFALAIGVGTALLMTPLAAAGNQGVGFVNALFTATSAACVTGLIVVDTGRDFSLFGQWVILILLQLGGLGIMTYSSLILVLLGRKLSFRGEALFRETFGGRGRDGALKLVGRIFLFTLLAEAVGAALLFGRFLGEMPVARAAYHALFHAVSAFCNAGFSLNASSLMGYRGDVVVNFTVIALVVLGGLGFIVIDDVWGTMRRRRGKVPAKLALHSKVVLAATGTLLGVGTVGILVLEHANALAGLGWGEGLMAALFQAVTPRTAGFNTLDYGTLTHATLFFTILLMFIGASPGSCGGGIKTTSAAVIAALFRDRIAGRERVSLFRRSVPGAALSRALAILVLSAGFIMVMVFALLLSEGGLRPHGTPGIAFLDILFETVSAFGTVGLSTGITAELSVFGKLAISMVMFVGRLGPLTLAMAVGLEKSRARFRYAEENLMVG